jgi:hypothetical protein
LVREELERMAKSKAMRCSKCGKLVSLLSFPLDTTVKCDDGLPAQVCTCVLLID